jgi:hypothetical protein
MRPLAMGRRRLWPIPSEPAAFPAGEGCREVGRITLGRFVLGVGAEGQLATVLADDKQRRPPPRWPRLRRGGGGAGL